MKQIKLGPAFTIFLLFFGIELLEAFRAGNWIMSLFWVAMALLFILISSPKKTHY